MITPLAPENWVVRWVPYIYRYTKLQQSRFRNTSSVEARDNLENGYVTHPPHKFKFCDTPAPLGESWIFPANA